MAGNSYIYTHPLMKLIFMRYELESDIRVMCLKSPHGPLSAEQTFDVVESKLASLRKRKFYGLSKLEGNGLTYLSCVKMDDDVAEN